jgi:hypothetical protein
MIGEPKGLEMLNRSMGLSRRVTQSRRMEQMQTAVSRHVSGTTHRHEIVYRTVCGNPGCGFEFDLRITPENASLLGGSMACPHCKRNGGQLKSQGRVSEKLFAAKLLFRTTGTGATE